ncbi:MAG: NAD(P)H-quinone oxidoreductase [Pseudomonadota bacterium]
MSGRPLMKAMSISEPGGPEVLTLSEVSTPTPSAHEVLIKVAAAGVNRPDCLQRQGLYPLPPGASPLPGLEIAGEVVECGANVTQWRTGERVIALTHGGGYAEYCVANEGHCLPWPEALGTAEAAAVAETSFTVQSNLFTRAGLTAGERVLIHGGSSGIGATAIQLAKLSGAWVATTAGSDEKCEFCTALGADLAINYKTNDWLATLTEAVGESAINVVFDMVAGPYVMKNVKALAEDGRYSMIAFLLGPKVDVNFAPILTKRLCVTGSTLRPQSIEKKTQIRDSVQAEVWPHVESGALKIPIFRTFALAEAAAAHTLMESSQHMGKIVLEVV